MICGSGGSKSRLAKAAGAEPSGQMRDEKVHAVVAKHISKSKRTKHTSFGPLLEVEMSKKCMPLWCEAHFEVKNVQSTPRSDHFWKLRCRKSARRCGAKHISRSKCTKHTILGPLSEVEMSRKSARRCGTKHMYKAHHARTTFGHSDLVSLGRRKGLCTLSKVSKT